jgi:hypothetical protein
MFININSNAGLSNPLAFFNKIQTSAWSVMLKVGMTGTSPDEVCQLVRLRSFKHPVSNLGIHCVGEHRMNVSQKAGTYMPSLSASQQINYLRFGINYN